MMESADDAELFDSGDIGDNDIEVGTNSGGDSHDSGYSNRDTDDQNDENVVEAATVRPGTESMSGEDISIFESSM